jgi:hypothetical protein
MPPAKKTAASRTTRTASRPASVGSPTGAITRKEVEQATARFDKALDEAMQALSTMREDLGKGAKSAYKDIASALKALRRDAQKTNRSLIKDLEKLRGTLAPAKKPAATRKSTAVKAAVKAPASSTAPKAPARTAGKPAASKPAARKPAARKATKRTTDSRSPAK